MQPMNRSSSLVTRHSSLVKHAWLCLLAACVCSAGGQPARGQWTIDFVYDEQQFVMAVGPDRVMPTQMSLMRVKNKLEAVFGGSTGNVNVSVSWSPPPTPNTLAETMVSQFHVAAVSVARDKLINQATADNESQSEIILYESLPMTSVPFVYDTPTQRTASSVSIPNSLNKHLGFAPTSNQTDGTVTVTPETATIKWQFWKAKPLPGRELFELVMLHESLHVLGFLSLADLPSPPAFLSAWDLFRVADSAVPVSAAAFPTVNRELRPTIEATCITRLGSSSGSYKATRGARSGGDGFGASHWRSSMRLDPMTPIGIMDPAPDSAALFAGLGNFLLSRADVEAMDTIGWNIDPLAHTYSTADQVEIIRPAVAGVFPAGEAIQFEWMPAPVTDWSLYIFPAGEPIQDSPVRAFEDLQATSITLEGASLLPPGDYTWSVTGSLELGYIYSDYRCFTVLPACTADFNSDGIVNTQDMFDFLAAFFASEPNADINHDTFINSQDFFDFLGAFNAGC